MVLGRAPCHPLPSPFEGFRWHPAATQEKLRGEGLGCIGFISQPF